MITAAVIYARFSTDKQREASIEDQARLARVRAEREDWPVVALHSDEGISGSVPVASRPGGARLLADAMADRFQILLIEGLDRLSRDLVEQERIVRRIEHRGIRLIGVADGYDSQLAGRKLHRGMRGLINEVYLDDLRAKTHRGLAGQVERGYFAGGLAYGYRSRADGTHGHRLVINETEAEWVRWIFQQYSAGKGCRAIAVELNLRGVPAPRGGTWAVSAIYGSRVKACGILNNEIYLGRYTWNRTQWVKDPDTGIRQRLDRPRSEWKTAAMPDVAIVAPALWQAVKAQQELMRQEQVGRGRGPPKRTLLGGMLRCGHCGAPVVATDARRYGCSVARDRGTCVGITAGRRVTEHAVLGLIAEELLAPANIALLHDELRAMQVETGAGRQEAEEQAQRRLVQCGREIERLTAAIADMGLSPALRAKLAATEAEQATLQTRLAAAPSVPATTAIPNLLAAYRAEVASLPDILAADLPRARGILRDLVGTVRLVSDEFGVYAEIDGFGEVVSLAESTPLSMVAGVRFRYRRRVA